MRKFVMFFMLALCVNVCNAQVQIKRECGEQNDSVALLFHKLKIIHDSCSASKKHGQGSVITVRKPIRPSNILLQQLKINGYNSFKWKLEKLGLADAIRNSLH